MRLFPADDGMREMISIFIGRREMQGKAPLFHASISLIHIISSCRRHIITGVIEIIPLLSPACRLFRLACSPSTRWFHLLAYFAALIISKIARQVNAYTMRLCRASSGTHGGKQLCFDGRHAI